MSKLKAVLAAAAALIAGGTAIGLALNQAGVAESMTTAEWCAAVEKVRDVQKKEHFFVAFSPGPENTVPQQAGGRVLGDCSGGTCTIAPDAAPDCDYTYTYDCGPTVDGWRVCDVWAHPYVVRGWKLAADEHAYIKWFGSFSDVVAACQAHTTGAKCLQLLDADKKCWLLNDGSVCRYGSKLGVDEACPYALVSARMPCTVYRGAGSEMTDATRTWTDEELDEL